MSEPPSYCTVAQVAERALIKDEDLEAYTEQIETCIAEASRWIDDKLRPHTEVPLEEPFPESVSNATADLATAYFQQRHLPDRYKETWVTSANEKIAEYIKSLYKKGVFYFVGKEAEEGGE